MAWTAGAGRTSLILVAMMVATYVVAHLWLPKDRVMAQEEAPGVSAGPSGT